MILRKQLFWTITFAVLGTTAAVASEGGISGGGTDYRPFGDGSAWFLGARTIKVCYEVAPDFVPSGMELDVPATFFNAFELWKSYYQRLPMDQFLKPQMRLDFNYEIHSTCSGSEDLALYLGVMNENIARARLQHGSPVALVDRESYDLSAGWGKGLIWVASTGSIIPTKNFPNWAAPLRLQAVITHELGHVLGCDHVSGTIMQENLADLLTDNINPEYQQTRLSHIDGDKLFYPVYPEYDGVIGVPYEEGSPEETFRLFMDRKPIGKTRAHFAIEYATQNIGLDLTDDQGTVHFSINLNATQGSMLGTGTTMGSKIWQIAWQNPDGEHETFSLPSFAAMIFGTITASNDMPYIVSIEINMNGLYDPAIYGPVSVWYYGQGFRRNLFSMPIPQPTN